LEWIRIKQIFKGYEIQYNEENLKRPKLLGSISSDRDKKSIYFFGSMI